MSKINKFEDLEVYQLSLKLTKEIYQLANKLPSREKYNIVDQLIRASSSTGANIAEGFGRDTRKEFIKYLYNSRGSLMEVRHFINLILELKYSNNKELENLYELCNTLGVKLNNLIKVLKLKQ